MFTFFKKKHHFKNNYGLTVYDNLFDIAKHVCIGINGDNIYANLSAKFLVEIAQTETKGGRYWDQTTYAGMGLTQIDKIGFLDTINRTSEKRKEHVLDYFGVDLDKVEWVELRHNPRLCFLITRLFLMLRPGKIPDNLEDRAKYWKKWYNTEAGKGTVIKFVNDNTTRQNRTRRV
jgi:hypothetical protein